MFFTVHAYSYTVPIAWIFFVKSLSKLTVYLFFAVATIDTFARVQSPLN